MIVVESTRLVPTADNKKIRVYRWEGASPKRGAVQIAHGMGEHALRYRPNAQAFARAGYDVYANDHRGHGELAAQAGELGDFGAGGFQAVVAKALVLQGHSMGSFAAQLYMLDHSELLDGVALSGSTALDLLGAAAATGAWRLEDLNASFEPARTPFDWLSRDEAAVDAYVADPLCGFNVTPEILWIPVFFCAAAGERIRNCIRRDFPLFLFAGDRDPVNANLGWFRPLVDRYRDAGLTDVSWHIYGGARHEVLNEINRPEVVATLQAWINRVGARN